MAEHAKPAKKIVGIGFELFDIEAIDRVCEQQHLTRSAMVRAAVRKVYLEFFQADLSAIAASQVAAWYGSRKKRSSKLRDYAMPLRNASEESNEPGTGSEEAADRGVPEREPEEPA